jgi:hypothetical protein
VHESIRRREIALELLPVGEVRDRIRLDLAKLRRYAQIMRVSELGLQRSIVERTELAGRLKNDRGQTDGEASTPSIKAKD